MSAKKYLTTTLFVSLLASISSIFAQTESVDGSDLMKTNEETPQFLIRTEHHGKVKYVECALPNLYFHKATASTPEGEMAQNDAEFTAKGGTEVQDDYYGYVFFLVQDDIIIACNESGAFDDQPSGLYTLSRFTYPLSISPESFEGKNFNTVNNHPLFEKDKTLHNITIRLLAPKNDEPVLSTEPFNSSDDNILGQIQTNVPISN
jgi:hypothetical protein